MNASQAPVEAARAQLRALQARLDAGTIDAARYDAERRNIDRALSDALLAAAPAAIPASAGPRAQRPSLGLVAGLALAVLALAAAGYAVTGSPRIALLGSPPERAADAGGPSAAGAMAGGAGPAGSASGAADDRQSGLQQIAAMVDSLAERMKSRPDDAEGWTMLARSYTVLGRFKEALPAYRRASELQPSNAGVLADYADAVAAQKGSVVNPESAALIERALAADPKNPKALALAGTAAYEGGDFAGAIARWQRIVDGLPPQSELAQQVNASIAEAKQRLGGAPAAAPSATAQAMPNPPTPAPPTPAPTAAGAERIRGTVTLSPELAARASKDDAVFVFARPQGGRMPLAVLRAKVADLPLEFSLDDSLAMAPTARLSGATSVVVGARVSKSGNAIAQPGDLAGEAAAPVAPGANGVSIRIGSVVGER